MLLLTVLAFCTAAAASEHLVRGHHRRLLRGLAQDSNDLLAWPKSGSWDEDDLAAFTRQDQPTNPATTRGGATSAVATTTSAAVATGASTSLDLQLFNAVNAYRAQNGLPAIPYSKAMSAVADQHTDQLVQYSVNPSSAQLGPSCQPHSWMYGDNKCCYDGTSANGPCMWNKPQQLAGYPSAGFEILMSNASPATSAVAESINAWSRSPVHNPVILNQGMWNRPWKALGCSVTAKPQGFGWFAVCWFGNLPDSSV